MRLKLSIAAIAGGIIAIGIPGHSATAATPQGFTGHAQSSVPGCPYLAWRLALAADGKITGIAYYSDLSGVSMVNGKGDGAGHFTLNLTSSMGNGPVGTVNGTRSANGTVVADMTGQGCANMHLTMQPLTDINHWTNAGGGG
ncbi:MAG: hypothetical protein ABI369_12855 [Acetobacteraceae bacterium]